jgi:hypothetical protein
VLRADGASDGEGALIGALERPQRAREVFGAREARMGCLLEAAQDHALELGGHVTAVVRERRRNAPQHLAADCGDGSVCERRAPRE